MVCRLSGPDHPNWGGGRKVSPEGYVSVLCPGHPRATKNYVREHILVAERALGKPLPDGAVVHHVNETRDDNRNANLAIFPGTAYHNSLHKRLRVLRAGGNPWTQKLCGDCCQPKDFDQFYKANNGKLKCRCIPCVSLHDRRRRHALYGPRQRRSRYGGIGTSDAA